MDQIGEDSDLGEDAENDDRKVLCARWERAMDLLMELAPEEPSPKRDKWRLLRFGHNLLKRLRERRD